MLCSVFIMSQASATMATTTIVTVVCSSTSYLLWMVTKTPSLMWLPATSGQHDLVLPPLLTPKHSGGVVGLASVPQQQPLSRMPLQTYASYAVGPTPVGFYFRVEPPTILYFICLVSVLVYAFCFHVPCWMLYSHMGPQPLGFATLQPFGAYPWQAYVLPGNGHWPTPGMHRVAAPCTALSRGEPSAAQSAVIQSFQLYDGAYSFGGLAESHQIHPPFLHGGEVSSIPGLVPSNDTGDSESAMGIKPGDSGVVIGYHVDAFTHTWSAEQFIAHSPFILHSSVRCHH